MPDYNKLSKAELIEGLEQRDAAMKLIPSIIYACAVCDEGTKRKLLPTFISNNIAHLLGYTPAEILGSADWWQEHIHPDDRAKTLSGMEPLFGLGKLNHQYRLRHKDGYYLWVRDEATLIRNDAGHPVKVVGSWLDITQRKWITEELKKYEKRCQVLLETILDVYYQTDLKGRLLLTSPSCLPQTGYRPEEVLGRNLSSLYVDPKQLDELMERLLRNGEVNDLIVKLRRKNGTQMHASISSRLRVNKKGQPIGTEGILRDVTERMRIEEEQQSLLQENRRLTRQLMHLQEEERRMLARDLHDELGQFLTTIFARAEYISEHAVTSEIRQAAEEIIHYTKASFKSSHDILKKLRPPTLDTLGLSAALTELAGEWSKHPDFNCSLTVSGEIETLDKFHAIAVYRLIQEGLNNAKRHGRAEQAEAAVRIVEHSANKKTLQVEICDCGKGLHTQKAVSGMGITGMRERVHALGGTFMLTNLPGDGVRIKATIPLHAYKET